MKSANSEISVFILASTDQPTTSEEEQTRSQEEYKI
jgi:hypothetical protein